MKPTKQEEKEINNKQAVIDYLESNGNITKEEFYRLMDR